MLDHIWSWSESPQIGHNMDITHKITNVANTIVKPSSIFPKWLVKTILNGMQVHGWVYDILIKYGLYEVYGYIILYMVKTYYPHCFKGPSTSTMLNH